MTWKHTAYHINNSAPGHVRLKQQLDKSLKITFASSSKNALGKKKENDASWKSFYVTLKRNNKSMTI